MSSFFILNNVHFALEILGAQVFLVVAWLAFDSFLIRKDFTTISRGIGFMLLAAWQVVHAFGFTSEFYGFVGYGLYFVGILFILSNMLLEHPVKRPEFKAVILLPSLASILLYLNIAVAVGFFIIAFLAYRQYRGELKKTLAPFTLSVLFLAGGALASAFYLSDSLGTIWMAGHGLQFVGFAFMAWWVWQYLQLRIREELLIIFVSTTLVMATIVTLTFSSILVGRIESETKSDLLTDARVLDFALLRLREESLAKVNFIATDNALARAVAEDDFVSLEELATGHLAQDKLGFLLVTDSEGLVLVRAHGLTQRDDTVADERAVSEALLGNSFVTTETSEVEKFSIRSAAPLILDEKIVGVVVGGFQLDNALVDSIKKITGLETSIFEGNIRVATTSFNPDGRTRSVGIKHVDKTVTDAVLSRGEALTVRTEILSRPFLASYIPIRNSDDEIVGMISAAKAQQEIIEIANNTNRLTLVSVMIIMLILIMPIYIITRRLAREVS